jgi:hypothetical protein
MASAASAAGVADRKWRRLCKGSEGGGGDVNDRKEEMEKQRALYSRANLDRAGLNPKGQRTDNFFTERSLHMQSPQSESSLNRS